MRTLLVYIEIKCENKFVGEIVGNSSNDACFSYDSAYLNNPEHRAISIGLPLEEKTFDTIRTRNFFEGLLPEGFTRKNQIEQIGAQIIGKGGIKNYI